MKALQQVKRVDAREVENEWKIRWFRLNSIKLNFGLAKNGNEPDDEYKLICYKCFQVMFGSKFSDLLKHIKSKRHLCSDIIFYEVGGTIPGRLVLPRLGPHLPTKDEYKQDNYSILSFLIQGIQKISSIKKSKHDTELKIFTDFKKEFFADALSKMNKTLGELTQKVVFKLYDDYNEQTAQFRRELTSHVKRRDFKGNRMKGEEMKDVDMLDKNYDEETKVESKVSDMRYIKFTKDLTKNLIMQEPLIIMERVCTGKSNKYLVSFKIFYKWYEARMNDFQTIEMAMLTFITLIKSGQLSEIKSGISSAGINNYIKAYNFYVKHSGDKKNKTLPLVKVRDKKFQVIVMPEDITEEMTNKLRTEYEDTETLRAFNLANYCGLRAFEIAQLRCRDIKYVEDIPGQDEYMEIEVLGKGNKRETVPCFNKYMIDFAKKCSIKVGGDYWFFKENLEIYHKGVKGQVEIRSIIDKKANALSKKIKRMSKYIFDVDASLHDFRRTCATRLYEDGLDTDSIQQIMRHENIKVTLMYIAEISKKRKMRNTLKTKVGVVDKFAKIVKATTAKKSEVIKKNKAKRSANVAVKRSKQLSRS